MNIDHLFDTLSHPDFLAMKGLTGEVPIFIQTYDAKAEPETVRQVGHLSNRLRTSGITLAEVNLFDLILDHLKEENRLDRILEREATLGKQKLIELLANLSDPQTRLIPRLVEQFNNDAVQLTLLTGVGQVFPFLRTHTILESLQPAMMHHPVIMFFPGEYIQESVSGSQLRLFGTMANPPLYRPYYRAFNLEHYRI